VPITINPLVLSLRYAFHIDVDLAIIIEKQRGKMKKKKPQK
jgi:uncharacterized lipoprotein YajG